MTSLTTSPAMVALVQTASTLPVFLLGLPSGAMADIVDRRRYLMVTQLWIAANATLLCLAIVSGLVSAPLLLALTFVNGVGLAMRWPVYSAIIPELVPRPQMPAALALNGVAMNASRIIGPIVAGALIAGAGTIWVFMLNALLSLVAVFVIWRWRREPKVNALPGERFLGAMRVGVQYVRQSVRMRTVLFRIAMFFAHSSALLALLPLIARQMPGGSAGTYTALLASMGTGAILSALLLPRWRRKYSSDELVRRGSWVQAATMVLVGFSPNLWLAMPLMVVCGISWLTVANTLGVSAQLSLPNWVRARGMSMYQMALMGGSAMGAALWGQVAELTDLRSSLVLSAITGTSILWFTRRRLLKDAVDEDLTPSRKWAPPEAAWPVAQDDGPVLVTIEYRIDPARADEFREVMRETRRRRLAQGALSWELFRDSADPARFVEYVVDESWLEQRRRFERLTAADEALRERRVAFHVGDSPPKVTRCIADPLARR
jgi:MFS family permease